MVSARQRRRMMLSSHPLVRGSEGDVSLYRQCPSAPAPGPGSQERHRHSATEVERTTDLTTANLDLTHDAESPRVCLGAGYFPVIAATHKPQAL